MMVSPTGRKRVVSGMRTTGKLHLGNYVGALANWVKMQDQYDCSFFLADWHALTTDYAETSKVKENSLEVTLDWLAAGNVALEQIGDLKALGIPPAAHSSRATSWATQFRGGPFSQPAAPSARSTAACSLTRTIRGLARPMCASDRTARSTSAIFTTNARPIQIQMPIGTARTGAFTRSR